jgi:hypothetical protein
MKRIKFISFLAVMVSFCLAGSAMIALAEPPVVSWNFNLLGMVDNADDGTSENAKAYSKIAPWPDTDGTTLNTGCYENDVNAGTVGCFRVVDVADPANPVRIATVEPFDRVNSPRPPPPNDQYWTPARDSHNVWTNDDFNNLPFSTECKDWEMSPDGKKHIGPGWHETPGKATCWDKGWITRTHYTAGASGDFKPPNGGIGGDSIYWVNSQRLRNAPSKRLGYTGVAFYDLKDPANPEFLGRIDMEVDRDGNGVYRNAGGVHHGFVDGRYAFLGADESGYVGRHLVIVDAIDPANPVIVGRWWYPGQKTPEEDHLRDWIDQSNFSPITYDTATGKIKKRKALHYISVHTVGKKDIAVCSYHQAGLILLDVTDRTSPVFLSQFDYLTPEFQAADTLPNAQLVHDRCVEVNGPNSACGNAHSAKLVPGTDIVWMSDEYFNPPYGHLRFFDVKNLKKPQLLSHFILPRTLYPGNEDYPDRTASTHLGNSRGDILFLAWYGLGVQAVNFSDPVNPYLVGSYSYTANDNDGGQATYDVIFDPDGNLVVSDSEDGVRVLKYTGPGSPLE